MLHGKTSTLGDLAILLCCILWSLSFGAMKLALSAVGPFWLIAIRFAMTAAVLVVCLPRRAAKLTRADWISGAAIGVTLSTALFAQASGLRFADTGKIAFLTSGYVAVLPVLLWLWGRTPNRSDVVSAGICTLGVATLSWTPGLGLGAGELCGILAALSSAAQILAVTLMMRYSSPLAVSITQSILGTALSVPLALAFDPLPQAFPTGSVWLALVYLAIGCTLVPFALQMWAQPLTTPTRASLIFSLESVFATLVGVAWFGETVSLRFVVGAGLVLASLLVSSLWRPGRTSEAATE